MKKGNAIALLPIGIFLVIYLGLGMLFEYVMDIEMGFYNIPVVIAFLIAILVACIQNRKISFDEKLELMAKGVGDKNIITMILIFLVSGAFVGVVGRSSAESVAYFMLSIVPAKFAVAVLFVVAAFVSTAMGTSCGTITLLVPVAVAVAQATDFSVAFCTGVIVGGAMFGDNLSFISDTTIAACNTQGCDMKDKFRTNFGIALPAAIATLIIVIVISLGKNVGDIADKAYNLVEIIPYIIVLVGGIAGINVFVVLIAGIVSGSAIAIINGTVAPVDILANMGSGAEGMYEIILVTFLVSSLCALIKEYGGFDAILSFIYKVFKGKRGGQIGMGLLVSAIDVATANNTVAIVIAGPIAKEMSKDYDISPKVAASILDTFSCIVQGILPYGAQLLYAVTTVTVMGEVTSAFEIIPYLIYPYMLLISSIIMIVFGKQRGK